MALDWGTRRIGIAASDELGISRNGLPTLDRTNIRADLDFLAGLIRERQITRVVVGQPLNMDGSAGKSANLAHRFGRRLAKHALVEVVMWDERLTSWEAESQFKSSSRTPGLIDQAAAILLLESYLDAQNS